VKQKAKTGLARALSKMGYCSRSRAADMIRSGQVTLNGRIVRDPQSPVNLERDSIAVNQAPVSASPKIYLMMNKPRGLVTTASDEKGRATVYDLLKTAVAVHDKWIVPVGRLDKASEGLLLFTNNSIWAAQITDPASNLEKRYHVQIDCVAEEQLLAKIMKGVQLDGEHLCLVGASILRVGAKNSWIEVSLTEGKNRHIRRLLEALGVQVLRLMRVSIGPLELGDLKKGAVRQLTESEIRSLARPTELF
jgi:23S rRNA pseudouridine2605 synthase